MTEESETRAGAPDGTEQKAEPGARGKTPAPNAQAAKAAAGSEAVMATAKLGDAASDPASAERLEGFGPEEEDRFRMPGDFDPDPYGERFSEAAAELGLSGSGAEKLVRFWNEVAEDLAAAREDAWIQARREWAARTMRDREIGGANLDRTVQLASRVVNAYGSEELKEVFRATGLGNHPEVVRFMARVGRAVGEDELHLGSQTPTGGAKSPAELIYGRR